MTRVPSNSSLQLVWLHAAVLGSVWASIEIIVGSFLHNLRVPFTGTTLTAVGVCLLVAGQYFWPDRGIIWRAGVICALMKSVSPSAVLLGPMIGILTESLMLQLAVGILGRNPLGFIVGGGLATIVPLAWKIVEWLIAFGFNIAKLFVGLYKFAANRLGITGFEAYDLLAVLLCIYAAFGMLAAILGMAVGRRAWTLDKNPLPETSDDREFGIERHDPKQRFSILFLLVHIAVIPLGMIVINLVPIYWAAAGFTVYAFFTFRRYPRAWRRLKKPQLWIGIILIAAAAGFVLGRLNAEETGWTTAGLVIGLQMALRALLMLVAFSSLSAELRNPVIIQWFFKRGMGQLSAALEVAFAALPRMVSQLKAERKTLRYPLDIFARLLVGATVWLESYERKDEERSGIEP